MATRSLSQTSFFDPRFAMPDVLVPGSVAWVLAEHRSLIFPDWLAAGWRGSGRRGRKAWPARVLLTLLLLRWSEEGMSRLGSCDRAEVDARWRAAMGLRMGGPTPCERTMRDFERFLREVHPESGITRVVLLHEQLFRICCEKGIANAAKWAADSTPMWCYGAVQDTVRLLGDGLARTGRWYASATKRSLGDIAREWKLPLLLAKSTKGHHAIDWRSADARATVITELAEAVTRVSGLVRKTPGIAEGYKGQRALELCVRLLRVVEQDLEQDELGRLVVARGVAENRLISLRDPSARHGRKTRSEPFNGFKLHALGDLVSGLIAAVFVAPANVADNAPMHKLVARAKRAGAEITCLLGDTAYGPARDRVKLWKEQGVRVVAPVASRTTVPARHPKEAFTIDFALRTATCPNGVTTSSTTLVKADRPDEPATAFHWPRAACATCPLLEKCCEKGRKTRTLHLHPYEQELRAAKEEWARQKVRSEYRPRAQFERVNHLLVRHGGRQARAWGLSAANLQAHVIAMRCNLQLLAEHLATVEKRAA